jgi:hypothetical protein
LFEKHMPQRSNKRLRERVAQEAARIMYNEGVKDFQLAKRKAINRIGLTSAGVLPRNKEIELALRDHQRLFSTTEDNLYHAAMWRAALESMRLLRLFNPRLVGSILEGIARPLSPVNLHVFSETVEDVIFTLLDGGIPWQSAERRLRHGSEPTNYPCVVFTRMHVEVEAVVFLVDDIRRAPISAIDGKPMRRANISEVERRVEDFCGQESIMLRNADKIR